VPAALPRADASFVPFSVKSLISDACLFESEFLSQSEAGGKASTMLSENRSILSLIVMLLSPTLRPFRETAVLTGQVRSQ
jgi:hypothetical protein